MKAVSVEPVARRTADGKTVVRALIVASETPETLPVTGEGVEGMNADQVFAPFSILYVMADADAKVYITDESGAFVAQ